MTLRDAMAGLEMKVSENVTYDQIHNAHLGLQQYVTSYQISDLWSKTRLE